MKGKIGGAIIAPYLPFNGKRELQEKAFAKHVDVVIKAKPDCLYCLGSVDEFPVLTVEQRKRTAESIVAVVAKRVPVSIHIGTMVLDQTIELAQHSERIGADALYCVPPYYYVLDDKAQVSYFKAVAASVSIPVHLYNIPETTKVNFSTAVLVELGKIPNLTAVKDSAGNLVRMQEYIDRTGLDIFQGDESLHLSSLVVGAAGCVAGAVGVVLPQLQVDLLEAFRQGNLAKAMSIQARMTAIRRALLGLHPNWIQVVKEAIRLVWGIDMGKDIVGYSPMEKEDIANLERTLKNLQVI